MEQVNLSKKFNLSLEERDLLHDFLLSDYAKVLEKVLGQLTEEIGTAIMSTRMDDLTQESLHRLASNKLKYEGAEKLLISYKNLVKIQKKLDKY